MVLLVTEGLKEVERLQLESTSAEALWLGIAAIFITATIPGLPELDLQQLLPAGGSGDSRLLVDADQLIN